MCESTLVNGLTKVISKFISLLIGQAQLLPFSLICAASVLLVLQLPSGYSQDGREPLAPAISGQTAKDAAGADALNSRTDSTNKPIAVLTGTGEPIGSAIPDKHGQVANVKTYGAVGDGVTDDTAAFNAALKSVADAGGGACLVPKGTYIISASGITAPHRPAVSSDVHFVGEGRGISVLKVNGMPRKLFASV